MSSENVTHINVSLFGSLTCQGWGRGSSRVYDKLILLITMIIIFFSVFLFVSSITTQQFNKYTTDQ